MKQIGATIYGIDVKDSNHNQYEMHTIYEKSFIDIMYSEAIKELNKFVTDKKGEVVFTYSDLIKEKIKNDQGQELYEVLYMRVKTGEYGIESEIVDSETGDVSYNKKVSDADVMPFGCCIMIPSGKHTSGVIVFQSIGRYGISTVMKKKINGYIKNVDSNLRVAMGTIVPKIYMDRFFKDGILKSVRMIRYGIPDDASDKYGVDRGVKTIVEERIIRKPRGFLKNKAEALKDCLSGKKRYDEVVQINDFEIDDLRLEFSMGKRVKTISLKNIENVIATEDITKNVILDNGHPEFGSLCIAMKETGEFYLRAKGLLI